MIAPRVSCVIPVYNGERYIAAAIESAMSQTVKEIEIIVVDDGSTDATRSVIESMDCAVRYLYQENAGHGSARNRGIEEARVEYVAFLDADDLWERRKVEIQLGRFEANPNLEVSFTHVQNFWSEELEVAPEMQEHRLVSAPIPGWGHGTMLAKRDVFDRMGLFDSDLQHGPDSDWILRASEAGVVMEMLEDVLVKRRLHGLNLSIRAAATSRAEYVRIVKASLDRRRAGGDVKPLVGFEKKPSG